MTRKGIYALVLLAASLLALWLLIFPGIAAVQYVMVNSQSCTSPEKLQQALAESGWHYRDDRDYYLVSYSIRVRSFLPIILKELKPSAFEIANGVQVYALPPLFANSIEPWGQRVVYCEFLFEVEPDASIADKLERFAFVLRAGGIVPTRIKVTVASDAIFRLNENPTPG